MGASLRYGQPLAKPQRLSVPLFCKNLYPRMPQNVLKIPLLHSRGIFTRRRDKLSSASCI